MKRKTPAQRQIELQEQTDKLNKLEKAYAAKKLSEREYLMWKEVYARITEDADFEDDRRESMNTPFEKRRKRVGRR